MRKGLESLLEKALVKEYKMLIADCRIESLVDVPEAIEELLTQVTAEVGALLLSVDYVLIPDLPRVSTDHQKDEIYLQVVVPIFQFVEEFENFTHERHNILQQNWELN